MNKSRFGFSLEELNSKDSITAVAALSHETQSKKPAYTEYLIGTYGILYAGQGTEGILWGGGPIDGFPLPMLARGIHRLLSAFPPKLPFAIYTLPELWRCVGKDGYARRAKHKHRPNFAPFRELIAVLDKRTLLEGDSATRRHLLEGATVLAKQTAYEAAKQYREDNCPNFTNIDRSGNNFEYDMPPAFTVTVKGP